MRNARETLFHANPGRVWIHIHISSQNNHNIWLKKICNQISLLFSYSSFRSPSFILSLITINLGSSHFPPFLNKHWTKWMIIFHYYFYFLPSPLSYAQRENKPFTIVQLLFCESQHVILYLTSIFMFAQVENHFKFFFPISSSTSSLTIIGRW